MSAGEVPIIIVLRDPDFSNEFIRFGPEVVIHDVDFGRADLSDREEFLEWRESHLVSAGELELLGKAGREAAERLRAIVAEAVDRYHPEKEER
jgi:hypothetical protein